MGAMVSVLGPVVARVEGTEDRVRAPMQLALLGYLALIHPRSAPVAVIADQLWFAPPATAANTIQQYVSALRRSLGRDLVVTAHGGYGLAPQTAVDVAEFRALATRADRHLDAGELSAVRRVSGQALVVWSSADPLGGLPECPFVEPARAQLLREVRRVRLRHFAATTATGGAAAAIDGLRAMHESEPLDEHVAAELMRALAADGRQAEAFDIFAAMRNSLADELGVDPGPELRSAHQAVLTQRTTLPRDAFDAQRLARTVPAPGNRLLGRESELAHVEADLEQDLAPLLTITGFGGVGKTSLATVVAQRAQRRRPVLFVPLAQVNDPGSVLSAIAARLSHPDDSEEPDDLPRQLGRVLRDRDILLVLDNFEHVLSAAPAVGELARHAAGVLVTSRERLLVEGERVIELASLAVDPGSPDGGAAVRLFVERSVAAGCDPAVLTRERDAVHDICVRVDGLPLALELAAARTSALSPRAIVDRLDRRLSLLTTGQRGVVARHRSLRACIESSVEPLGPSARRLLATLSMFPVGATLDALEAVTGEDPDHLVDELGGLVAKSLTSRRATAAGDRYVLLQVVGEYAEQLLDQEPLADALRGSYVDWAHGLVAARLDGTMWGALTAEESRRSREEVPHLRLAMDLAHARGDVARYADLAVVIARIWLDVALLSEARRLLATVRSEGHRLSADRLVDVVILQGVLACIGDRAAEYEQHAAVARELLRQHPDSRRGAALEMFEFDMAFRKGDQAMMARHLDAAREHACAAGDAALVAWVDSWSDALEPLPAEAWARLERALLVARDIGHEQIEELALTGLSNLAARYASTAPSRWQEARAYAEAAELIICRFGAEPRRATAMLQQAEASIQLGDRLPEAAELSRQILTLLPADSVRMRAQATVVLGAAYARMGHEEAALSCYVAAERKQAGIGRGLQELLDQSPTTSWLTAVVDGAGAERLRELRAHFLLLTDGQADDVVVLAR